MDYSIDDSKLMAALDGMGERLRQSRKELRMTQTELSLITGITIHRISEIERGGVGSPTAATLFRLCAALGVSADWVLGLDKI